jgi:hypothetical protein
MNPEHDGPSSIVRRWRPDVQRETILIYMPVHGGIRLDCRLGTSWSEVDGIEWTSPGVQGNRGCEAQLAHRRLCKGKPEKGDNTFVGYETICLAKSCHSLGGDGSGVTYSILCIC